MAIGVVNDASEIDLHREMAQMGVQRSQFNSRLELRTR